MLAVDAGHQVGDLLGFEVVDAQRLAPSAGARISSPVSSIVSGRSYSDRAARVLRPVA